jgi:glutamyl-tRNA synthetase
MSKRHGATSVIDYKQAGYLPEAMRNYLLRLGWSHGDAEIISDAQAREWFSLEKVGRSPSRFDFMKLAFVNKNYIKEKPEDQLLALLYERNESWKNLQDVERSRLKLALKFVKERAELLGDLEKNLAIYLDNAAANFDEVEQKDVAEKKFLLSDLSLQMSALEDWSHDGIKNFFNEFAATKNLKIKDFGPALRLVLTFSKSSAGGIFDVVEILGKAEVLRRIESAIN